MLTTPQIADLVTALLTVNQYPLHKAAACMAGFEASGLLDPVKVAAMPQEDVNAAMRAAGYDRGNMVPILSFRLYPLMEAIQAGKLDGLADAALSNDPSRFVDLFTQIHGVGPRVAEQAWLLWTSPPR